MGLFSHFYKRPRPNQLYKEGKIVSVHEGEAWTDLFIDLIFVAFFIKLGQAISYCLVHEDLLETKVISVAFFIFFVFFFLRLELDMYANYFHSRDVVSRLLYLLFVAGIGTMAISMPGDEQGECLSMGMEHNILLLGYFIAHISIIIMYIIAMKANPETQVQFCFQIVLSIIILFLFLIFLSVPRQNREFIFKFLVPIHILFTVPFLGQFVRPYFNERVGPYFFSREALSYKSPDLAVIPLNIHACQTRLCLFIMMVTGEGMIQVITPTLPDDSSFYDRIFLFNASCLVILFGNAMLYADAVLKDEDKHCMHRAPKTAGLLWMWMHVVTGFFVFLIGICVEIIIHDVYENEPIAHAHDTILGISCGTITLCLNIMRASHKGLVSLSFNKVTADKKLFNKNVFRMSNYIFRSFLGAFHFLIAYFSHIETSDEKTAKDKYIYLHALVVIFSISVEIILSLYVKVRRRDRPTDFGGDAPRETENSHVSNVSEVVMGRLSGEEGTRQKSDTKSKVTFFGSVKNHTNGTKEKLLDEEDDKTVMTTDWTVS